MRLIVRAGRIAFGLGVYLLAVTAFAAPQMLNVRDFGAKGDGLTDDSPAIEKASLEVARTGGVLVCPPGDYLFDPSRHKIVLGSNMQLTGGCLIRVTRETGNYRYIISGKTPRAHLENVVIDGISIDQNALAPGMTARVDEKNNQTVQVAMLFYDVQNLVIRNTSIVSSGTQAIVCSGPNVRNVRIDHDFFSFRRRDDQRPFDNSAVYIDGTDFNISNNVFRSGPDQAAFTAIEVHTGAGTVSDNIVDWYLTGINVASTHGLRVRDNTITRAERGIALWAPHGSTVDSEITGNMVSLNSRMRLSKFTAGIFLVHYRDSRGAFQQLTIADNIVAFEPDLSRDMSGSETYGVGLQSEGPVDDAKVLRNTIVNAPVRGIKVGAIGGERVSHVTVSDNTIVNAGVNDFRTVSTYRAGIALDGLLSDIEVGGNVLTCTGGACGSWGIYASDRGDDFQNVRILANFVRRSPGKEYGLPSSVDRAFN